MVSISELIENGQVYFGAFENQSVLFEYLAAELSLQEYIQPTFLHAILAREAKYPTGIVAHPYNIALPHVESEHVKQNALVVVILENPLEFHRMDNVAEVISVKVIFMLLIKDLKCHVQAISNLTKLWFDEGFMEMLIKAKTKEEVLSLVKKAEKKKGGKA